MITVKKYQHIQKTKTPLVINPCKYYIRDKESIYVLEGNGEKLFIHYDWEGRTLFRSKGLPDIKPSDLDKQVDEISDDIVPVFTEFISEDRENDVYKEHKRQVTAYSDRSPIMIGGCGRTGTTLLLSILDAHEEIVSLPGESFAFYPKPYRLGVILYQLQDMGVDRSKVWCEKTPKHVFAFDEINDAFDGNVCLINMVRDGRDVVTSIHPTNPDTFWVSVDRWVEDTIAGFWNPRALTIKYEDLVQNPRRTLDRVCKWANLPFQESMLRFYEKTNIKTDAGWFDGVTNIHTKRMKKWESPEFAERIEEFYSNERAMRLMKDLDYL